MKKKSLTVVSLILSMLMIMSVFSVISASAEVISGTDDEKGISWEWDPETKTLTINGEGEYPVYTHMYYEPWYDLDIYADVKTIVLGEGFTSTPENASFSQFSHFYNASTVKLPDSLRTIGYKAFHGMDSLSNIDFGNGVETIGEDAFLECPNLDDIKIPDSVKTIEAGAFDGCSSLRWVDLGNGVETIRNSAFFDTAIQWVTIPDSIKEIAKDAFGYYLEETYSADEGISNLKMTPAKAFEIHASADNEVAKKYAKDNGYTFCTGDPYVTPSVSLKAGGTKKLSVKNVAIYYWDSFNDKVALCKDGVVYGLKKGTCKVFGTSVAGSKRYYVNVTVTTSPTIKIGGKAYKAGKTYAVKKGKKLAVKITGKSSKVKNKYTSSKSKVAKVVSKTTAKTANIKGYKKGTTTIKITVNGVTFKFKVKVK